MGKIKSKLVQLYLRNKFNRTNQIYSKVSFSRDLIIGSNNIIHSNVVFDTSVVLKDNIKIGRDCFLSSIKVDSNTMIESGCITVGNKKGLIEIGENVYIGINNCLDNSDNIKIGNNVQIAGPSTAIYTHIGAYMALKGISLKELNSTPLRITSPVIIENNVYIGCNCTIYPGVKIRHHSVIAPNSAVTKDVEPFTMVGGVPSKKIKDLNIEY